MFDFKMGFHGALKRMLPILFIFQKIFFAIFNSAFNSMRMLRVILSFSLSFKNKQTRLAAMLVHFFVHLYIFRTLSDSMRNFFFVAIAILAFHKSRVASWQLDRVPEMQFCNKKMFQ